MLGEGAHTYRLGPRALEEQAEWNCAGDCLYGKDGVMSFGSPAAGCMKTPRRPRYPRLLCAGTTRKRRSNDKAGSSKVSRIHQPGDSVSSNSRMLTARRITTRAISKSSATFQCVVKDEWFRAQAKELRLTDLAAKDDHRIEEERACHDDVVGAARVCTESGSRSRTAFTASGLQATKNRSRSSTSPRRSSVGGR